MTSPLTEIQKAISEMREARQNATLGPWSAGRTDMMSYDGDGNAFKYVYMPDDLEGEYRQIKCVTGTPIGDSQFIALAANRMESLLSALEKACEALENLKYADSRTDFNDSGEIIFHLNHDDLIDEALSAIVAELKGK